MLNMVQFPDKLYQMLSEASNNSDSPIITNELGYFKFKEGVTTWEGLKLYGMRTILLNSLKRNLNLYGFFKNHNGWYVHHSGLILEPTNFIFFKRYKPRSECLIRKRKSNDDIKSDKLLKLSKNIIYEDIDKYLSDIYLSNNHKEDLLFNNINNTDINDACVFDNDFKDSEWLEKQLIMMELKFQRNL